MSLFGLIEYSDATPEVRAVYDDIMATRKTDWINNFWKALAHDPVTLKRSWETIKPVMPAMASEAPINWRNPRRETESSHSDAPLGNSRCIISRNSSEPASSSRLRQYSGPLA